MLSSSVEDFDSSEDIYEAVGEILHEVAADRTEYDIRGLCSKFHNILKPENERINSKNRKILDAPVLLGQMGTTYDNNIESMTSIWVQQRNDSLVSFKPLLHSFVQLNNFSISRKSTRKSSRRLKPSCSKSKIDATDTSPLDHTYPSFRPHQPLKFLARKTRNSTLRDNLGQWIYELRTLTFPSAIECSWQALTFHWPAGDGMDLSDGMDWERLRY